MRPLALLFLLASLGFGAELQIRVNNPAGRSTDPGLTQLGDAIHCQEDGQPWGTDDRWPNYGIVRWVGLETDGCHQFMLEIDTEHELVNGALATTVHHQRRFYIDVADFTAEEMTAFQNNETVIRTWSDAEHRKWKNKREEASASKVASEPLVESIGGPADTWPDTDIPGHGSALTVCTHSPDCDYPTMEDCQAALGQFTPTDPDVECLVVNPKSRR